MRLPTATAAIVPFLLMGSIVLNFKNVHLLRTFEYFIDSTGPTILPSNTDDDSSFRERALNDTTLLPQSIHQANKKQSILSRRTTKNKNHLPKKRIDKRRKLRPRNVTLLAKLRGELGNHLSILGHAIGVAQLIEKHYPHLSVKIQGQRQLDAPGKGKPVADAITQCFPYFRNNNVELRNGGRWQNAKIGKSSFLFIQKRQDMWLSSRKYDTLALNVDGACKNTRNCWREATELLLKMHAEQDNANGTKVLPPEPPYPPHFPARLYTSLPFLTSDKMSSLDGYLLNNWKVTKKWFQMNLTDPRCCDPSDVPRDDDVVWHYRNFAGEGPRLIKMGFQDLDPETAVTALFRPLLAKIDPRPRRLVIVSRYTDNLQPYIDALKKSNLTTDVVVRMNGTATTDFCFLRQTKNILVGNYMSTFARWAGLIGRPSQTILYLPNTTYTRKRHRGHLPNHFPANVPKGFKLKVIPYD
jgi:hypothetical protein